MAAPADRVIDELAVPTEPVLAVVSSRPAAIRSRLDRYGTVAMLGAAQHGRDGVSVARGCTVLVGEPEAWQSAWGELAALRPTARFVFHDCPLADFRAITRSRELPPPVDSADTVIVREPDGRMFRARLSP